MIEQITTKKFKDTLNLSEFSIVNFAERLRSGSLTARQIVEFYISQINKYNNQGPHLGSVLEINPDALNDADALDVEIQSNGPRTLLHGIPFLVKDNINTRDSTHTSNGSYLFYGNIIPSQDASIVAQLRKAGAIMLGKSNMSELARIPNSMSARGGVIRNPYDLTRSTNGSSSGSAAAVSANFAAFALGTDNVSSIRFPAADSCVVGLKLTPNLIDMQGVYPADPWNVLGIIARYSSDIDCVLRTLIEQRYCLTSKGLDIPNELDKKSRKLRVGVLRDGTMGVTPEVDDVMENAIEILRKMDFEVVDDIKIPDISLTKEERQIANEYNQAAMQLYFRDLDKSSPIRSKEQIDFLAGSWQHPSTFRLPLRTKFLEKPCQLNASNAFSLAINFIKHKGNKFVEKLQEMGVDFITFPTKTTLPFLIYPSQDKKDPRKLIARQYRGRPEIASLAGLPEISVPAGFSVNGLPVGISFVGKPLDDLRIIYIAKLFENETRVRRPPDLDVQPPSVPSWLPSPPKNNFFNDAIKIMKQHGELSGNTYWASLEPAELHQVRNSSGYFLVDIFPNQSVWYSIQPSDSGELYLNLQADASDHKVFVYTGSSIDKLREVPSKNLQSTNVYSVKKGIEYRIAVTSRRGNDLLGEFDLSWSLIYGS